MKELPKVIKELALWTEIPRDNEGNAVEGAHNLGGGFSYSYDLANIHCEGLPPGHDITIYYNGEEHDSFTVEGDDYEERSIEEINRRVRELTLKKLFESYGKLEERVANLERLILGE